MKITACNWWVIPTLDTMSASLNCLGISCCKDAFSYMQLLWSWQSFYINFVIVCNRRMRLLLAEARKICAYYMYALLNGIIRTRAIYRIHNYLYGKSI